MTGARRRFLDRLVAEHLEEASFLYEQRHFLLESGGLPWPDVADNEARYARHLFALDLLTRNGADHTNIDAPAADPGGLHTAVSLACRQGRFPALEQLTASADLHDDDTFAAVADALKWCLPTTWRGRVAKLPHRVREPLRGRCVDLAALVFGYRRWPLDPVLALSPERISPEIIRAIGLSGAADGIARLRRVLDTGPDSLRRDAAVALARRGYTRHLEGRSPLVDPHHWSILPLGLLGRGDAEPRIARLVAMAPSEETLTALALLGRPSAVPRFISLLSHPHLGDAASAGLALVTGADLVETVFVPEAIDPETLSDEERARLEQGEPLFAEDEMPGETVTRRSRNPSDWEGWWQTHRAAFRADRPYRLGQPYTPESLVDQLASRCSEGAIRSLAVEELAIRYRVDFAFETDLGVCEQQRLLAAFREWLSVHGDIAERYAG